jgi:type II restriction/modification system DNA methylase subunit YeeA
VDPVTFQQKWITRLGLKERTASQSHFNDLCSVLGQPNPIEADPTGDFYTFERGAEKAGGAGDGWADVWYRGHFAWEYKGHKANLEKAYLQLLQYKDDLENPPLLIVSDLNVIEIHTNFTDTIKAVHRIDLSTFAEPKSLDILRRVFSDPLSFKPGQTRESVTAEAASRFSSIALGLHQRGMKPAQAAHFLVQLLFCLFAEDVRLLPNRIFSKMIDAGLRRPDTFATRAAELLNAMNTGGEVAYEDIPRFNGGLFQTVHALDLTRDEIDVLKVAAALDWSSIEPAIFGTLFERSLDPAKRSQLGAHYTGRKDIDRVVEPVVMQPLLRRWDEVKAEADAIRARWLEATTPQTQRNRRDEFARKIAGFLEELSKVRILDPACGSGNFLYVALERLLTLEKEVMTYRANAGLPMGIPAIRPHQVLGLEINEYAHELAQVAIWIGYLQWMLGNGFGYSEPVLDPLETIRLQDALLDLSGDQPSEAEWPVADFIIGNPPFLGGKRLRAELGDAYVNNLFTVYKGKVARESDLCCYFFEQAREELADNRTYRAGLLATNSIRDGANRKVLERIKESGSIFEAWSDEPWILDGAAVRISIIAFDDRSEVRHRLNGQLVNEIYTDLTSTLDLTKGRVLAENQGLAFQGPVKVGPFELDPQLAKTFLVAPINVNGRPNSDVVRPWMNGMDIVRRPRGYWIIDFGVLSEEEASLYEIPFEYVRRFVKPVRDQNRDKQRREKWWRLGRSGEDLKNASRNLQRLIATPRVSRHRLFVWVNRATLPDSRVYAIALDSDYAFGVLSSRVHEVWSMNTASFHGVGNDPTYNAASCFMTFPFPWPPGQEPADDPCVIAIGEAAKRLNDLRENWLNPEGATETDLKKRTLTNLYNARPQWLANAHAALDRAVWVAYGWDDPDPATVEEDTILSRLLALNLERSTSHADTSDPG